jgi:photosystem II stability/assembly factor-like uncharacterized protein
MRLRSARGAAAVGLVAILIAAATRPEAQSPGSFNEDLLKAFTYRNVGPFRMQVRVADIAVPDSPPKDHLYTIYQAPWIGGVWKTTNNGTTWEPIFDAQPNGSIGDVALSPSQPDIVWVGTGDAFASRSSYAGDGIYKSTDAGKTWKNMGLRDSHHIARVVVHPTDPGTVYAAVLGHLYSTNPERGVFKTTNGGETWEKVFYIDEKIGIVDLVINPKDPAVLYAAAYDKVRLPWQMVNGGPGSGIYKTTDAGRNWTKLAGGLPAGRIGRIGLDIYPRNPDILYAIVENVNPRTTPLPAGRGGGAGPGRVATIGGEVYRTENAGQSWTKMNRDDENVSSKGPYYFNQVRVDPNNDKTIFLTGSPGGLSKDGGKTWGRVFPRMFGDFRTYWFDPQNPDRVMIGGDGGIAISYDGGKTGDAYNNLPLGSIYAIGVDNEEPYNIYAGLQDHENWKGPSNGPAGRVDDQDWLAVGDGDGMFTVPDPKDSRWLYTTRHYGAHERVDQKLGYRKNITPQPAAGKPPYRWLWCTPIYISPHDSHVVYTGGQNLLRSTDQGDHWTEISPDLSTNPADKILPESEGGVPGGIPWFAISTISESPLTAGVIWVGTSDGRVHVTRDTGGAWADVTGKLTALGAREDGYVSRVHASHHVAGRAFVAKSGYKFDDFRPYLYRTDDFGATWKAISTNLPNQPINVVFEDHKNPNLLFVGNDTGVFVSMTGGERWVKMNNNMPNVPVHDLLVHPRDNDLVVGSYGRGVYITNINALQQLNEAVLTSEVHLFDVKPVVQRVIRAFAANDYLFAQRNTQTPNEPGGMIIQYYLKAETAAKPVITIANARGEEVAKLNGTGHAGINTARWTTRDRGEASGGGRGGRGSAETGEGGEGGGFGRQAGPGVNVLDQWAPLGEYTVTLDIAGRRLTRKAQIVKLQGWSIGASPQIIRSLDGRGSF